MKKLSGDERHERRVQVIRLRKSGLTYDEIAQQTGEPHKRVRHLQAT